VNLRRHYTYALAIGLGFAGAVPAASFADTKAYPGTLCVEAGDTTQTTVYGLLEGAGGNGSSSSHTYNCSAVREVPTSATRIGAASVTVSDGSTAAGITCYAISRSPTLGGGGKTANGTTTAAFKNSTTLTLGAAPVGSGVANGIFSVVCQLPGVQAGATSSVLSYVIDEV
jgi:hypothetical protein